MGGALPADIKHKYLVMKLDQLGYNKRNEKDTAWVDWMSREYKAFIEDKDALYKELGLTEEELYRKLGKAFVNGMLVPTRITGQNHGVGSSDHFCQEIRPSWYLSRHNYWWYAYSGAKIQTYSQTSKYYPRKMISRTDPVIRKKMFTNLRISK